MNNDKSTTDLILSKKLISFQKLIGLWSVRLPKTNYKQSLPNII